MAFKVFNSITGDTEKEEILNRIRQGDEKALEILYKKHYKMMIRLVINNSGSEEEGKDIYQDALISFWQKIRSDSLTVHSKISTYLYGVCMNLWRKELSRKKRLIHKEKDEVVQFDTSDLDYKKIVVDCISELDQACRNVLMYYYFDGMSMQEIANELGLANTDTAKVKKYKCKLKLKQLIELKYTKKDLLD